MVTNYTTKCYIKSGSENASRKPLFLYTKIHIYTKFNTPKNSPSFRCACFTFSVIFFSLSLSRSVRMASEAPIKSQNRHVRITGNFELLLSTFSACFKPFIHAGFKISITTFLRAIATFYELLQLFTQKWDIKTIILQLYCIIGFNNIYLQRKTIQLWRINLLCWLKPTP